MSTLPIEPAEFTPTDPVNPLHCFQLDRRNFLKLFGGGLLVCLTGERALAQEAGGGFGGRQQVPTACLRMAAHRRRRQSLRIYRQG